MGPQRSVAAVVAAGFAVIVAVIIVAWVAMQPRAERKAVASTPTRSVEQPSHVDETQLLEVLVAAESVPVGTDLLDALDQKLVVSMVVPEELRPEGALTPSTPAPGTVFAVAAGPGTIITPTLMKAPAVSSPAPMAADCPTDWTGTVAADERLVFLVTATVAPGTSVSQAYARGLLHPYLISEKYVPAAAVGTLAPVCSQVAAYELSRGTMLLPSTFVTP